MKVLVVDDHSVVREGLKWIISKGGMEVVDEAGTGDEVLPKVRGGSIDAVVLDLDLPGRGGLDIVRELKREFPKLPILILSIHPEQEFGPRVLKAGADGYLMKNATPELLVEALRRVSKGGKYLSSALAEKLALDLFKNAKVPHERLSDREFQVMRLMAAGQSVSEVADSLSLSVKTVSTYRARILAKLEVNNTAEIIRYALRHQLVD